MTEQTKLERDLDALDKCVAHWDELSRCKTKDEITAAGGYGVRGCALCHIYNRAGNPGGYCTGCPVREHTGQPFCYDTPHVKVEGVMSAYRYADSQAARCHMLVDFRAAAVEERAFLQAIRDKLAPPETLVTESHKYVWFIVSSYDWNEGLRVFPNEVQLLLQVRKDFEIDDAIPLDSKAFWDAATDAYEADDWKAYTAARIDTATGEHHIYGGK